MLRRSTVRAARRGAQASRTLALAMGALLCAACAAGGAGGSATEAPSVPPNEVVMCASLADYGLELDSQASAVPTIGPMPSLAPGATPSTGILEAGEVAVLGDEDGPGALLRIGDVRICDRYPNRRTVEAGYRFVVVREELLFLRDGFMAPWIDASYLAIRREDWPDGRFTRSPTPADLPGVDFASAMTTSAGDRHVGDIVVEVPGGPATQLFADYRDAADAEVPGVAPVVSWSLGELPAGPEPAPWDILATGPTPAPDATGGRIGMEEHATVRAGGEAYVLEVGRFGQVAAYPGVVPTRGTFVEAYVTAWGDRARAGIGEWRAVDAGGATLPWIAATASQEDLVLGPLMTEATGWGWLVVDAPPAGEVRLEYRQNGEGPVLFEVLLREG